jgi:hypothetical protein
MALCLSANAEVSVESSPSKIIALHNGGNLYISFDLILSNDSKTDEHLMYLEMDFQDSRGNLLYRRFLGSNGKPGSIETLTGRTVPSKGRSTIFNPFQMVPDIIGLHSIRASLYFTSGMSVIVNKSVETYETSLISMPLKGSFFIEDGDDYYSHHRRLSLTNKDVINVGIKALTQRHALDITVIDEKGEFRATNDRTRENWFGWGKPVYSPVSGTIVNMNSDAVDNTLTKDGERVQPKNFKPFGNFLVIELKDGNYIEMAHFREDDLKNFTIGDQIQEGQLLGTIGLSGDTSYPHLHLQKQSGPELLTSEGLPIIFRCVALAKHSYQEHQNIVISTGDIGKSCNMLPVDIH